MLIALRIAFYLQFLLGLFRSLPVVLGVGGNWIAWIMNERIWETHISLGVLIAVLALIALRPHPRLHGDRMRTMARFAPLLPLATGLLLWQGVIASSGTGVVRGFIILHIILGIASLGLIEMASARQRRASSR